MSRLRQKRKFLGQRRRGQLRRSALAAAAGRVITIGNLPWLMVGFRSGLFPPSHMVLEGSGMARAMRDEAYRDGQWARRYTGRVAAVNRFIDEPGAGPPPPRPPDLPGGRPPAFSPLPA